jgi:O-antigen chain-terminating methyltransferase
MIDGFYRAFEDKHRGSRALIKERQRVYLPLIQPLVALYPDAAALDLGCGRGEWLELLVETGFNAQGIDLDDGMLAECRARGLSVQTQDALTALQSLPANSQAVVSGFHFAEHIPFEVLQQVVQEALRVLKPAGLLILETPNPENVVVGTANFYLDPSHNRPLPPLLMAFLPEYYGFERVKVLRLQEPVQLDQVRRVSIHDVLGGVSPDYAIVAQKHASPETLQHVSQAFAQEYGVTLAMLSGRYEQDKDEALQALDSNFNKNLHHEIKTLDHELNKAVQALDGQFNHNLDHRIRTLDYELNVLVQRVDGQLDERIVLLSQHLQRVDQHLQRVDQHLHRIESRRVVSLIKRAIKKIVRPVGRKLKAFLENHHELHATLVRVARPLGLYGLLNWALNRAAPVPVVTSETIAAQVQAEATAFEQALAQQPAAVRDVFEALDATIKKTEKP